MLEDGPANDWFEDAAVRYAAIAFVVGMVIFFWRALSAKQPIVDLSAFMDRNFATGSFFSFIVGIGLYGLTYLYPVFLARVRGYSSMMIGETMFITGIAMFLSAPIIGKLSTKLDPRVMIAAFDSSSNGARMRSGRPSTPARVASDATRSNARRYSGRQSG